MGALTFGIDDLKTPVYVVDQAKLIHNLDILAQVAQRSGAKILLAQKAFSMFEVYPLIKEYLSGTTASGLYEARLGHEEMGLENHVFSPAYTPDDFAQIVTICDHIVFNSLNQWQQFKETALNAGASCGLRVNPQHSTQTHAIYDPCAFGSRFGILADQLNGFDFTGIEGIHFHTLCEQNSDALKETLDVLETKFGSYLHTMKWVNFGGGHHITRADYDVDLLVECVKHIKDTYQVDVYLEPGEAIALNAGYLVSEVIDIVENGMQIAIIDASATCHMPDVIEMPYRPEIIGAFQPNEKEFTYRLGGPTCLTGDVIGDYSFDAPLAIGDKLVFCDMAIYSMVKNNTFNGMRLPDIALTDRTGDVRVVKRFGYEDFKNRLS